MATWVQYQITGKAVPDPTRRGCWDRAGRTSVARWLKVASLASEVKAALRRGKYVPAISAKQYREWAKGETRPIPTTFYDGRIDYKRAAIAANKFTS